MRRLRRQALSAVEKVATGDSAGSLSLRAALIAAALFAVMAALAATMVQPQQVEAASQNGSSS